MTLLFVLAACAPEPGPSPTDVGDDDDDVAAVDLDGDGWVAGEDCDDTDPARHPGAVEARADGVDNDCDGHIDCDGTGWADEAHAGDVGPEDLPGFCEGYCTRPIVGDLALIEGWLEDLHDLACVTEVGGDVAIIGQGQLASLSGLDSLVAVGG